MRSEGEEGGEGGGRRGDTKLALVRPEEEHYTLPYCKPWLL